MTGDRFTRAIHSLQGLSCGDAFGERFFLHPDVARSLISQRALPTAPWPYTDDTVMTVAIAEILEEFGEIKQEELAESFGRHYMADKQRGYGPAMHSLLPDLARTPSLWKGMSKSLFNGKGSFGNGAAMRVAPIGAYFADDLALLVRQAGLSAGVTHSHPEGVAGAIAVALGAGLAARHLENQLSPDDFLLGVLERTPESDVKRGIKVAIALVGNASLEVAVAELGSGARVSAQDTVPFCLWVAAHHLDSYEEALWTTVSGLGDRDTTCAIVGGIVAMSAGPKSIPPSWLESCEPAPAWFLYQAPDGN